MRATPLLCPADDSHGPVLPVTDNPRWGWYCPHDGHERRPQTHPLGPSPASRKFFTTEEVDAARAARAKGGSRA